MLKSELWRMTSDWQRWRQKTNDLEWSWDKNKVKLLGVIAFSVR